MVVSISRDHAKVTPSQFVGGFNKLPVRSLGVRPFLFVGFEGVCGVGLLICHAHSAPPAGGVIFSGVSSGSLRNSSAAARHSQKRV
jgi:hypothetical protein